RSVELVLDALEHCVHQELDGLGGWGLGDLGIAGSTPCLAGEPSRLSTLLTLTPAQIVPVDLGKRGLQVVNEITRIVVIAIALYDQRNQLLGIFRTHVPILSVLSLRPLGVWGAWRLRLGTRLKAGRRFELPAAGARFASPSSSPFVSRRHACWRAGSVPRGL